MADTPTRSLRAATNPQARMQELLSRDVPLSPAPVGEPADATSHAGSSAVADATSSTDGSAVAQTTDSADSSIAAGAITDEEAQPRRHKHTKGSSAVAQTTSRAVGSEKRRTNESGGRDPVREAMLGMLAQPYPEDMDGGAMTVTSVKIPRPIWERLEYARTITKRDKQDIIAEALRLYFDRIVEGETE